MMKPPANRCSPRSRRAHNTESGYAMLLVFAMAAMVAISLYTQLPRAAFEAQREKEALLVMHGESYKRAVQLYCRKMGRYPAKMEDLDNTQNIRFLRRHFIDPMTRKDEWRLLHMGPAGKLVDSKIQTANANDQWRQGSITEFKSAATDEGGPEALNLASRKRPSDDLVLGPAGAATSSSEPPPLSAGSAPGAPNNGALANGAIPGGPPQTAGTPSWLNGGAVPGMPPGMRGLNTPAGTPNANNPNVPGANGATSGPTSSVSGNGGYGSSSVSSNGGYGNSPAPSPSAQPTGFGGAPVNSQYQGASPSPYNTNPGSNQNPNSGFGQQGQGFNNAQAGPAQMINNLLTSPRPGGAPAGIAGGMGGTIVGGLAGVASTYRGHGIKRYADQDEYQKWEFFYDFGADQRAQVGQQAPQPNGTPAQNGNQSSFGNSFSNPGGSTPPPSPNTPPSASPPPPPTPSPSPMSQ